MYIFVVISLCRSNKGENSVLVCNYCRRHLGVWTFGVTCTEEQDSESAASEGTENLQDVSDHDRVASPCSKSPVSGVTSPCSKSPVSGVSDNNRDTSPSVNSPSSSVRTSDDSCDSSEQTTTLDEQTTCTSDTGSSNGIDRNGDTSGLNERTVDKTGICSHEVNEYVSGRM